MEIFKTKGRITPANDKTNLIHRFDVPDEIDLLKIKFEYSPKTVENREKAIQIVKDCFEKYDEKINGRPADLLPVKNLVTISVDENGKYRGAAHRQNNKQEHIIGCSHSSPGFSKGKITSGEWDIVLNIHYAGCDIDYTVEIEGEVE